MKNIAARQTVVTVDLIDRDPTAAELDAIELEMPGVLAGVDLLDAQIVALDRTPNELDERRIRRARRRVLAARRDLANTAVAAVQMGGAA
ncbi:DUF6284 family protein [Streptomyces sp. B-S-A8]|uniref:DUF6284 family protein n=1 Tax=Streptomyces solicavernae TaxID=3043614 RepID=A0ABT6RYY7_9ACTN|nr:DUF6284 family protein [Streptomyces sp. B-S-A8]MDI3389652.1 DUF6284 family protein [Streptomyces sp. B-S-A8]